MKKTMLSWKPNGPPELALYPAAESLPSDNGLVQLWCPINTPLHSLTVCSLSDDANGFNNFKNVHITPIQIKKPPNAFDNIVDKLNVRKKIPDYRCMEWMEDNRISVGIGRAVHIFNTEQEVHEQYSLKKRNLIGGSKHIPVRRRAGDILYYKEVNRNSSHEGPVLDVSYNSTRRLLASSSTDCVVRVWNLPTARRIRDYKNHTSQVNTVEWNPINHDFFLSGSNKEVILDDLRDYEPPKRWATKSEVKTVAWNHSNQYQFMINCADGTALVQDIRNGPHLAVGDGDISAVSYHPTKDVYATGSRTGMVKVWEANSSKELQQVNHMFRRSGRNKKARENICISCLSFSPDGENLAYGTTNGTFGLIKVQS